MDPNVEADGAGVWVTCAELARRKNISRQAAAKRVAALEADGKIRTRREGSKRLVDLAEYDRAVGEVGDAVKEAAAETRRDAGNNSPALRDAQTDRARYEARLKALDLAERQGNLLPIAGDHGAAAAVTRCGLAIARETDGIIRHADEIATAVSKDGVAGARRVLKAIAGALRERHAAALAGILSEGEAAERDGPIETELPDE